MTREELIFEVTESMCKGGGVGDIDYATLIVDRLLSKSLNEKQVNEVLNNLSKGRGVQNTLILIESF
ncbi:hypothetical protein NSA50_13290 [Clostridium sp. DSM 100503]|uniref:hypothetical protein n=1 Tax=Clostridium sp. DSM 100503 TaxID=2963282 RepID=UPI00214A0489|nr:hypothetical protein [Clostridium sp. DSM 100503]MCR1952018.1 hypothetical protein [Clostridium sp. DSM 100503]